MIAGFKNYEKHFLFHLKSSFRSRDIQIFLFSSFFLFLPVSHFFTGWSKKNRKVYDAYGCSFVAKLSWKKNFFLEKMFAFFTKYTLFAEKNNYIWKKKFYIDFFLFTEKASFTENEKNIYLIWEIFFYPENIYSFCKKNFFLIIKNIFVETLWWTQ